MVQLGVLSLHGRAPSYDISSLGYCTAVHIFVGMCGTLHQWLELTALVMDSGQCLWARGYLFMWNNIAFKLLK